MLAHRFGKLLTSLTVFAIVFALGISVSLSPGRAAYDNNGAQDEKEMIQIGLTTAATSGIYLNMAGKDPDLVGLGSYLVNVAGDCNGCHTQNPSTEYLPAGNPYLLVPPNGPFIGVKKINPKTYLGGGSDFGVFPSPGGTVHIISRNLTPGKSGMPEGDHTLAQFMQIIRTGIDLDNAHPNCSNLINTNCLFAPFDGSKLQVMPWPNFQNMTDRQITAIYTYLSAIPCLEGGPGEKPGRCQ
jgi:hypothetical protein